MLNKHHFLILTNVGNRELTVAGNGYFYIPLFHLTYTGVISGDLDNPGTIVAFYKKRKLIWDKMFLLLLWRGDGMHLKVQEVEKW